MSKDDGLGAVVRAGAGAEGIADGRSRAHAIVRDAPPVGDDPGRRLRRRRQVERIHRLGARVVAELLDEIGRRHGIGDDIDRRLAKYAGLDPAILAAVGGDRFPIAPVWLVEDAGDG